MGRVGEVYADAGLHVDNGSFAKYASELATAEGKVSKFSDSSKAAMTGVLAAPALAFGGVAAYGAQIASGFQDANTTLTTLYQSSDVAKEKMKWMVDFSSTTPFSFEEIEQGGIKLKAYGMDVEQYGRTFGDTAAGMGKNFNDVIEAVADAQTGEFERLKELGIKAIQVQKSNLDQYAQYGASVGDTVFSYVDSQGTQLAKVVDRNNREMITSTLEMIWNEKYAGAMESRSKTLSGMWSNLKDNMQIGLADMLGFDMETMSVQGASLMGILSILGEAALYVSNGFREMGEPMQTALMIAAAGAAGVGLLAAGFIAYGAILPLITADTAIFGVTLSASIWPITAIVAGVAILAAGLVWLDEKTGVVTYSWTLLKDLFTITVSGISKAAGILRDVIVGIMDDIKTAISNMIPKGFVTGVGNAVSGIISQFSNMGINIHETAEGIRGDNENIAQTNTDVAETFGVSGVAATLAGEGYNAAGTAIASTGAKATTAKSGVDALTQSLLDAATAQQNLWKAQNEIAKTNMTVASANKSIRESYGTSPNSLGTSSPDGAKIIPAKNGMTYNQQVQALLSAGVYVKPVVNVGTINNYGKSNSQTKTKLSVLSGG